MIMRGSSNARGDIWAEKAKVSKAREGTQTYAPKVESALFSEGTASDSSQRCLLLQEEPWLRGEADRKRLDKSSHRKELRHARVPRGYAKET